MLTYIQKYGGQLHGCCECYFIHKLRVPRHISISRKIACTIFLCRIQVFVRFEFTRSNEQRSKTAYFAQMVGAWLWCAVARRPAEAEIQIEIPRYSSMCLVFGIILGLAAHQQRYMHETLFDM